MFKYIILISMLILSVAVNAEQAEYRVVTNHPIKVFDGGSIDEMLSLSQQWKNKVLLKNPHMKQVDYLLSKHSEDRYDLLVVYHYQNEQLAALANQEIPSLIENAWPDVEQRQAFFKRMQSYIIQSEKTTQAYHVLP
ncbi:hypothetical protein [Thalassotalea ganghwensis]